MLEADRDGQIMVQHTDPFPSQSGPHTRVTHPDSWLLALSPPQHEAFKKGDVDTGFIVKYGGELQTPPPASRVRNFMNDTLKACKAKK